MADNCYCYHVPICGYFLESVGVAGFDGDYSFDEDYCVLLPRVAMGEDL